MTKGVLHGLTRVVDVDLSGYFDTIRHHLLLEKIARRAQDDDIMHLVKLILKANGKKGVPQVGIISPLLSNLYSLSGNAFTRQILYYMLTKY
ncbi:hypothetical protein KSU1_C0196 [Candidatus Jettenia caeni]|uniref:Reverse transcriptase domain-containing protein n=1 Tax=Candidatus Jettenia caeni TaxID=247490 RepID=I3IJ97_9BACT|nr:hypothetical protein KSU1_C0196 [Candidatus Jettenia caeni]